MCIVDTINYKCYRMHVYSIDWMIAQGDVICECIFSLIVIKI